MSETKHTPGPWYVERKYDASSTVAMMRDWSRGGIALAVHAAQGWTHVEGVGPATVDALITAVSQAKDARIAELTEGRDNARADLKESEQAHGLVDDEDVIYWHAYAQSQNETIGECMHEISTLRKQLPDAARAPRQLRAPSRIFL